MVRTSGVVEAAAALGRCTDHLESRVRRKVHARFGKGPLEKGCVSRYLADGLLHYFGKVPHSDDHKQWTNPK